jgi:hypothetical protein
MLIGVYALMGTEPRVTPRQLLLFLMLFASLTTLLHTLVERNRPRERQGNF